MPIEDIFCELCIWTISSFAIKQYWCKNLPLLATFCQLMYIGSYVKYSYCKVYLSEMLFHILIRWQHVKLSFYHDDRTILGITIIVCNYKTLKNAFSGLSVASFMTIFLLSFYYVSLVGVVKKNGIWQPLSDDKNIVMEFIRYIAYCQPDMWRNQIIRLGCNTLNVRISPPYT